MEPKNLHDESVEGAEGETDLIPFLLHELFLGFGDDNDDPLGIPLGNDASHYLFERLSSSAIIDGVDDYDLPLEGSENNVGGNSPAAAVNNLADVELRKDDLMNGKVICVVCREELVEGEVVKRLPCSHYYHASCISQWLKNRNTCPVCRFELPPDDNDDDPDFGTQRKRRKTTTFN